MLAQHLEARGVWALVDVPHSVNRHGMVLDPKANFLVIVIAADQEVAMAIIERFRVLPSTEA